MPQTEKPIQLKRRSKSKLRRLMTKISDFTQTYRVFIKTASCITAVAALTAFVIVYMNIGMSRPLAVGLYIDGIDAGIVENEKLVSDARRSVEEYFENKSDTDDYSLDAGIEYEIKPYRGEKALSYSDCYSLFYNIANENFASAGVLYIDGEFIAACDTTEQIQNIIDTIEYELLEETDPTENIEAVRIFNNIIIKEQLCRHDRIVTPEALDEFLRSVISYDELILTCEYTDDDADYTDSYSASVGRNDTEAGDALPGGIADLPPLSDSVTVNGDSVIYNGTKTPDIYLSGELSDDDTKDAVRDAIIGADKGDDRSDDKNIANSAVNGNINAAETELSESNGLTISVIVSETEITNVPYSTSIIDSSCYYSGVQTVLTKGANGQNMLVYSVTYVDGNEVSRELTDEIELILPVTEVICVGTAEPPECISTGTFIWPTTSRNVTSAYGVRVLEGEIDNHSGLDIAAPKNSSVYASDGGEVTFTGKNKSYGKYIIITHDGGYKTVYAHLNEINVERGDMVYQGQVIGLVGKTGHATGYHVHFEIRKNSRTLSPKKYLQ